MPAGGGLFPATGGHRTRPPGSGCLHFSLTLHDRLAYVTRHRRASASWADGSSGLRVRLYGGESYAPAPASVPPRPASFGSETERPSLEPPQQSSQVGARRRVAVPRPAGIPDRSRGGPSGKQPTFLTPLAELPLSPLCLASGPPSLPRQRGLGSRTPQRTVGRASAPSRVRGLPG